MSNSPFHRLDRIWARSEGVLIVLLLLAMVLVILAMAIVRNLTRMEIGWAAAWLTELDWTDAFLRKATLWLAFLGASQATYHHRHIAVDLLTQRLPLRTRYAVHAAVGAAAGLVMFGLTYSLAAIVRLQLGELPLDYGVYLAQGVEHVCDVSAAQLTAIQGIAVPRGFCFVRQAFALVGIAAEGPSALAKLALPVLFAVIGLRFVGAGVRSGRAVLRGPEALEALEREHAARLHAARAELAAAPSGTVVS